MYWEFPVTSLRAKFNWAAWYLCWECLWKRAVHLFVTYMVQVKTKGRQKSLSYVPWWPFLAPSHLSCQCRWTLKRELCLGYPPLSVHKSWSFETLGTKPKSRVFSLHLPRQPLTYLETWYLYCSQTPQKPGMNRVETGTSSVGIAWRKIYEIGEVFLVWINILLNSAEIFVGFQSLVQTSQWGA